MGPPPSVPGRSRKVTRGPCQRWPLSTTVALEVPRVRREVRRTRQGARQVGGQVQTGSRAVACLAAEPILESLADQGGGAHATPADGRADACGKAVGQLQSDRT